ncbi:monovalent cation/H+ antiporter complex subunit F [Tropicimonas sp. IMCC6043]|uniref:monovalent cation/H+ antiporter complex subunit F n=1 Tax=Tropicimonas sp. IMCC6043 TaxID=2510645 RepID=UPI00101BF2DB|nr:monovalent cation/H+ antiporter complex subunit F [Tropicimonas sp. IMCC6043]RYH07079.1 pH regulation protein F [Tropicimonas sp. IMCC6043]
MIPEILSLIALLATLAVLPRLVLARNAADCILAVQLAGTGTVAILLLLGAAEAARVMFDIALVFAALAAVAGIAFVALGRRNA